MNPLPRATQLAHQMVQECLGKGDCAIDATAGNGHDTSFLLNCVGEEGRVFAFDIQGEAIRATADRCQNHSNLSLHHTGHENIKEFVSVPVMAAMFNLGYLPGGDKSIITLPESTLCGIRSTLEILAPQGRLTVVLYTGHEGGNTEAEIILEFFRNLPQESFAATHYRFLNQQNSPPELLTVEKRN
ncbi:MAG: SAM-dependent methyltransferase [Verrucomicrobiales bacterium]|nr:SAM-dependent methyltransferase [Verrucomicrobiales bacterium]